MPEIKPDLSDTSRCVSAHWSLPVQCVLPRSHRANWHETWHPQTGNRVRYRRAFGTYLTEELRDGEWHDLRIPVPGDICGEPHGDNPAVFCQGPRTHNQISWTHRAIVDGTTYTWNTLRRDLTPGQVQQDMADFRRLADEQAAEIERLRAQVRAVEVIRVWRNEDGKDFMFADDVRAALGVPQRDAAANGETPPADGWVICSPAWLAAGGDCHNAPRRPASDPRYSHEHPAVSVPSA